MAKVDSITVEILRRLLRYERDTGKIYWLERPVSMFTAERYAKTWNSRYAGKEAITANCNGYRYGGVLGVNLYAHRIAMALDCGHLIDGGIDHINGDKSDNRIQNLRMATPTENGYNKSAIPGKSGGGIKGVTLIKDSKRWQAQIVAAGKYMYLGTFDSVLEAHEAYKAAALKLHGDFVRLS